MTENVPQALIERDEELARIRAQLPREPAPLKPVALARDPDNKRLDASLAKLREIAIIDICNREGRTADEAAAIVDAGPTLDAAADRARELGEAREAAIRVRMDKLGLPISPPALYEDVVRMNVPQVPATKVAGDWLRQSGARRALVMLGGTGLAKTASAGLCASRFIRWNKTVAYIEEPELVRLSERRRQTHEDQLEEILSADLLIIDELGTSTDDANDVRAAVYSAFNRRIRQAGAHTMMLGNLADDLDAAASDADRAKHAEQRFAAAYGARLSDRLVQMGTIAHLAGPSMRGTPYRSPGR